LFHENVKESEDSGLPMKVDKCVKHSKQRPVIKNG